MQSEQTKEDRLVIDGIMADKLISEFALPTSLNITSNSNVHQSNLNEQIESQDQQPQIIQNGSNNNQQSNDNNQKMAKNRMKQIIRCPACLFNFLKELREPYLLPCGHIICHDCIGKRMLGHRHAAATCPQCQLPIGELPLQFHSKTMSIVTRVKKQYKQYDEKIKSFLENRDNQFNTNEDKEMEQFHLVQKLEQFSFDHREIVNYHRRAAQLLQFSHPDLAKRYLIQRIQLIHDGTIQNDVENKNAATGNDLFLIGKIYQRQNDFVQALAYFKESIVSYYNCEFDAMWRHHFFSQSLAEFIIEDMQQGLMIIDSVLVWLKKLHKESMPESVRDEVLTLYQQKLAFYCKFDQLLSQQNRYVFQLAATCMLIANLYKTHYQNDETKVTEGIKFEDKANEIIIDYLDSFPKEETQIRIKKIMASLSSIQQAFQIYQWGDQSCQPITEEEQGIEKEIQQLLEEEEEEGEEIEQEEDQDEEEAQDMNGGLFTNILQILEAQLTTTDQESH